MHDLRRHSAFLLCGALLLCLCSCTTRLPLAPGCRPWLGSGENTEPPTHCLFFPSGVAIDPLGDLLYVANTNADLSFGGGALATVDLLRYERAVSCFRRHGNGNGVRGDDPCGKADCLASGKRLGRSATLEATENAELSAGAGAVQLQDFDRCYCEWDTLDDDVVNCESQRFILRDQTIKTGNFSGPLRLLAAPWQTEGTGPLHRTLYIPVRGNPSVTHAEVTRPRPFFRRGDQGPSLRMHCGLRSNCPDGSVPVNDKCPGETIKVCQDDHRVQYGIGDRLVEVDAQTDTCPDGSSPMDQRCLEQLVVPPDPFGLITDRGCRTPGKKRPSLDPTCKSGYQYLVTTHLQGGDIATFSLPGTEQEPGQPVLIDVFRGLFTDRQGRLTSGAFAVAPRASGDLSQLWYATSRYTGTLPTFLLLPDRPKVVTGPAFDVSSLYPVGQDVRDLIFEPGGDRAFVTVQSPPSLAVVDTRLDQRTFLPRNQVLSIVDVCPGPSRMTLMRVPRGGQGVEPRMASYVLVSCYLTGQVAFVDVDGGELLTNILVGRGPMSLALSFGGERDGGGIEPCADPFLLDGPDCMGGALRPMRPHPESGAMTKGLVPPRAYVAMYIDNTVAVIDLDPGSVTYRRLVSRIGLPLPKQVQ